MLLCFCNKCSQVNIAIMPPVAINTRNSPAERYMMDNNGLYVASVTAAMSKCYVDIVKVLAKQINDGELKRKEEVVTRGDGRNFNDNGFE